VRRRPHQLAARFAAPAAFLLAATVAILLIRSALDAGDTAPARETGAQTETRPRGTGARQPPPPPPTQAREQEEGSFYIVQPGDTLESIATDHGTSVERLLELNSGIDPRNLRVNQRLRVR
jgi:LysM repeat protein